MQPNESTPIGRLVYTETLDDEGQEILLSPAEHYVSYGSWVEHTMTDTFGKSFPDAFMGKDDLERQFKQGTLIVDGKKVIGLAQEEKFDEDLYVKKFGDRYVGMFGLEHPAEFRKSNLRLFGSIEALGDDAELDLTKIDKQHFGKTVLSLLAQQYEHVSETLDESKDAFGIKNRLLYAGHAFGKLFEVEDDNILNDMLNGHAIWQDTKDQYDANFTMSFSKDDMMIGASVLSDVQEELSLRHQDYPHAESLRISLNHIKAMVFDRRHLERERKEELNMGY